MNFKRKLKYLAASFLMVASTIAPLGNGFVRNVYADDVEPADAPVRSKTLKDNGDGTYTLTLSVTGKASSATHNTKANIVVIYDTSGSMKYPEPSTKYGRYGYSLTNGYSINTNNYEQLYYCSGTNWQGQCYSYSQVGDNDNHDTVYTVDVYGRYTAYTGPRYSNKNATKTRSSVAETALKSLGNKLLTYNTTTGVNDMVQIAFVDFSTQVNSSTTHTTPTTNKDTFSSWVEAAKPKDGINGGTNWEAALTAANIVNFNDSDPTYVIFVSDGNPTFRTTKHCSGRYCSDSDDNSEAPSGVHGSGNSDPNGWNMSDAQTVASTIVDGGKTLYTVGVFGDATNMQNLNAKAIYKDATNQQALEAAFDDIVKSITNSLSLTGLIFNDGITGMTSVAAEGAVGGFTYTKGGSNWADAPAAKFENGIVTWDLGNTVLSDGETATVSFIVYPSQTSLDLVADLNNNKVSYDSLTDDQKSQIIKSGDKYTLKTNTDYPTLTYKTVTMTTVNGQTETVVSDPQTVRIQNPDPVDLYQEEAELQKLWEDSLDPSQREDDTEVQDIYLQFYKKDFNQTEYEEYDQFHENYDASKGGIKVEKVAGSTIWSSGKISIAPGLMVSEGHAAFEENSPYGVVTMNGKRYSILNPGHDYKFGEADINNHFELTNYIYHPMLVDGTLMNVIFARSGNTFTGVESAKAMSAVTATNTIKGGINIQKKIVDKAGNEVVNTDDKFTVKAYLKNPDESDYSYDYRVYCSKAHDDCTQELKDSSGNVTGYRSAHIYGSGMIERAISTDDVIRVVNMNTGTLYYVEEDASNMPVGYSLKDVEYQIAYGGENAKDDEVAKTIDGKDYYAVAGNSASSVTVVNTYTSGNLKLTKNVVVQSGNATTAKNKVFTFTVKLYADANKSSELASSYKIEGSTNTIKSGGTVTLKDGESLTILDLPVGAYYEVVETKAAGYAITKTGDTGTITEGATSTAAFTNTYSVSGKVKIEAKKDFNDWRTGDKFVFKLNGDGITNPLTATIDGADKIAEFEVPINNTGTFEYTITEDLQASSVRGGIAQTSGNITASVTATDNGEGGLNFDVTYRGGEGEGLNTIVNRYSANGKIQLGASKILTGRDWQEGELYTFTLMGVDGKEIESKDVSKNQPDVVYSEISYTLEDAGKTFIYTIHESTPLPGGITNSGDVTATVTVEDNHDGTLKTTVVYSGGQGEKYNTIVNTYSAEGEFNFEATKVLEGRDWQNSESYSFVLKDEGGNVVDTQTVDKDHTTVSFKKLKFTQADAGEHKYTITETGTMPNGLSKSEDINVTLTVTDDKKGNLGFEADYSNNGTITNTYKATGEVQLEATKVLEGRVWREGESFDFELSGDGIDTPEIVAVTETNPTAKFKKIKYDQTDAGKTYVYTIKEKTDLTGMSIENSGDITVTVKLTDDGEGGIVPEVSYSKEDKTIKNTYSASGRTTLSVEKKLEGRDWKDGESYEFALKDEAGEIIDTKTISKNGTVSFKEIEYTKIGTYKYTIEEKTAMTDGMSNSGAVEVTVEVTDNYDGTLTATPTYKDNNQTIINTYKANGKAQLEATKKLEGRDWKDGESFTFELFKGGESLGRKTVTKNNPKAVFDEIKYTEADIDAEYVYTIKEVGTLPSGITSSGDLTVYVNITDNGDGTLNVVTDYVNGGTITNTYEANGKVKLEATKVIEGRDWLDSDEFTFELSGEGIETQTKAAKKGQEKVVFDEIKYTEADAGKTFTYTIKETTDLDSLSMTASGEITATVKVTDDGNGNLETEVSYTSDDKITNTYTARGEVELEAKKILEGRDWLEGESYDFVLSGKDGEIDRQVVDANETVTFKKINYTEADAGKTYTYVITEDGELKAGITKSGDITATVKLTDDGKGEIRAEVSYTNDGKITNTYETKPVEIVKPFTVKKKINDQSNSKKDASFKFELRDKDGNVVQTKEVTTKDLVGSVGFDAIKFEKVGTYEYTLVEVNDKQAGFSYDSAEHKVVIEVTDDYEKAQLVAKITIDGEEVGEVEFENDYKAEATSTKIDLEKILTGIDQDLAKEFEFILSDKNGVIETLKIKGSGKAEFNEIKFEKVGNYTYTVKETKGSAKGYTYDESEYTVTVKVSDNNANLEAEVSYKKDGEDVEAIVFENSYKPEEVVYGCLECKVPIAVKKVLEKRDLKDREFKFNIYLDGEVVATGYNTADGRVVLDEGITLDEAGTYYFVIKEDTEDREQDITYDESEYTFTIEVEDDGEGELKISSDTSSNVTFTNKYNEPGRGNIPPKPPVTYDGVTVSVVTLAISLVGLIGSLVAGKRYLKKEN